MQKAQSDAQSLSPIPRLRLTQARTDRRCSQQDIAQHIGTTHINVSRWERGITRPGPYFRRKLCALFGKTEEELDLAAIVPPSSVDTEPLTVDQPAPHQSVPAPQLPGEAQTSPSPAVARQAVYDPAIPLLSPTPLVGRHEEIARLRRRLRAGGNVALTALNGLPGVGKTALAITLAHDQEIRARFQEGVLWAGLGPQPNIAGVLGRWGTLLGMSSAELAELNGSEAWALALRTAIGSRRMLLIIDDAWSIENALTFKVGGPNCAHLITTRFPGIATHIAFDGATTIKELDEEEGITLLRLLAPSVVDREEQRVHDLVQAVGGLPLALTLIGNYLRKQAYSGTPRRVTAALERLSDAEERLHLGEPHGPAEKHSSLPSDIHLSLQSVFAVTDQQLSEQARAVLYALSVFPPKPNSFSEEAALAVAACTVEELDALADFGFLESSSAGRYTLHQTVADYARLQLHEDTVYERLVAYVVAYLEAYKKDYELLELESAIILAALETARTLKKDRELVRGVTAYAPFLLLRGLYPMAKQWLQQAHEAATVQQDHHGITEVLLYLGQIAQRQGDVAQAEATFQRGLALARQLGTPELITAFLTDLGSLTWKRGDYNQAEAYLKEGLRLAREIEDHARICITLETLGSIASRQGDYIRSEAYLQEALRLARQIGDREETCGILITLGVVTGEQGNYVQAEIHFQEGLVLARQIGHREWISLLLNNLGFAACEQGNYVQAEIHFQEGLVLARQIGHREWISFLLNNLGLTARKQGNCIQAEVYLKEGLNVARQIGISQATGNALYEYGNLCLDQDYVEAAEASFREILTTVSQEDQDLIALAQYGLARTAAVQGNIHEAQKLGSASLTALEAMGHRNAKDVRDWLNSV